MSWISVNEALPEPYETVLISVLTRNNSSVPMRYETVGRYGHSGKRWISYTGSIVKGEVVTHWQPMPEPPKEEVENVCFKALSILRRTRTQIYHIVALRGRRNLS